MGEKPLTWQQVLAIFVALGMFVAAIFAWGGNIPDEYRPRGAMAFWALLAVFVWLLVWSWRRTHRQDIQPDVLARVVPPGAIMQLGPMHLWVTVFVTGPRVRLVGIVQNAYDGEGGIHLTIRPERQRAFRLASSRGIFLEDVPPLSCAVPGAGFVVASCDLTLLPMEKPMELRLWLEGSARASGDEVRFARRRAVTSRVGGATTALALLGGALVTGGGTSLTVSVGRTPQVMPPPSAKPFRGWFIRPVPATSAEAAEAAIAQMLNEISPSSAMADVAAGYAR